MLKELLRPYYLRWVYFRAFPEARPAGFRECWRYPFRVLAAADLKGFLSESPGGAHPDVLWYPMTDWHSRMQRTQHLARALTREGHRGIYLNPHLGRQFESTPMADRRHRVAVLEPNLLELHVRLPREPVFHHRLLERGESAAVASAMDELLGWMGSRRAVQIVSLPTWLDAALEIQRRRGAPIIYDCHDLLAGFSNMAPEIVAAEARLLEAAGLVVFSSRSLMERHPEAGNKARLLLNGVDVSFFTKAPPKRGTNPVAGYVGAIEEWFECDWLRAAAVANPDCRFVVAGRVEHPKAEDLRDLPNVALCGEIPYEQVPEFVSQFDIGLVPFKVNDLTRCADPLKLYEYFACGIPVVSSRLPEVERHGELVYAASSAVEFAAAVTQALVERDPVRRERRVEVARLAEWRERGRFLAEWIRYSPYDNG